jgi:hypothetical protein
LTRAGFREAKGDVCINRGMDPFHVKHHHAKI